MYSDYKTLTAHGIDVFSVKTDAFTIKQADYETAQSCLCFHNEIGGWRCSKREEIKHPTDDHKYQLNFEIKKILFQRLKELS